ncbi:MAG TPA: metallophosphoesterase [Polyangiaceae bacterium LLY-WYZ-14_1]|nr:metallophosphoesterase [Polyangiaceae bacterium LLY-WYZ-14_1]
MTWGSSAPGAEAAGGGSSPGRRDGSGPRATYAVIGDVHHHFDDTDVAQLDGAGYDAVLFTGDLSDWDWRKGLAVARRIAALRTPAFVVPGNHDAVLPLQLVSEVLGWHSLRRTLGAGQPRRLDALARALDPARLVAYETCPLPARQGPIVLLAARPHAMGGDQIAFPRHLRRAHRVASLGESAHRLRGLIDALDPSVPLIVLAHNGPRGLGAERTAPFGCDFRPGEGDWGDPDLAEAVAHAVAAGRRVLAVVAGHMHHRLRGGGSRRTRGELAGVPCINAAAVPRHLPGKEPGAGGRRGRLPVDRRHHVRLSIEGDRVTADDVWLESPGWLERSPRR